LTILEFFHLIHVVDDEDEVDAFYDRLFAPRRFMTKSFSEQEKRWASLSMVSDLMLEVIEPSDDPTHQGAPLPKFGRRHGQHFHSFAWYVDPTAVRSLFGRLRAEGVRVAKPGGGVYPEGDVEPGNTIFTHPKDTFGQIEFEGKGQHWIERDPRFQPDWSGERWSQGPLGIEHLSHMTTIVRDLPAARRFYKNVLGARVFHETSSADATCAYVLVGTDTVIELASPIHEGSRMAADLASHGEMPHSATFRVRDLDAAERHVSRLGIGVAERVEGTLVLDPGSCYGAVWCFTDRDLPGDPRKES
jgi:predicted enzyme related to lactoylglutathione lyase